MSHNFGVHKKYLIQYQSDDSHPRLSGRVGPLIMLAIEPRMVSMLRARRPISIEHMSSWCQFLDPHLITYRSNTCVCIIVVVI